MVNVKSLKKTYEKHKQEREERARMKDYENELKEAAKVKREVCFNPRNAITSVVILACLAYINTDIALRCFIVRDV